MFNEIANLLGLGKDIGEVNALEMALRAAIVYVVSLVIIRAGSKRFLSKASAFDVIVAIMLGSIMSRAINGSAPFLPTLASGAMLIGLHWLLATLAFRLGWFGSLIKGNPVLLIEEGRIERDALRRTGLSEHDLEQAVRMENHDSDLSSIRRAYLERDGSISVIPYAREPRVVDVSVADGVQTIRIEMESDR